MLSYTDPSMPPGASTDGFWQQFEPGGITGGMTGGVAYTGGSPTFNEATGATNGTPLTGSGTTGTITNQQQALQAALAQGLQGQAAVDWVQKNYPQFNQYGSGIEWQPSSNTFGVQGGYFAAGPDGKYGFVPRAGGSGGSGGSGSGVGGQYGFGQYGQPFTMPSTADFQGSPGFQWAVKQGQNAIQNSAAAKGTLLTGGTLKSLAGYTTGAASQNYNDYFNQQYQTANGNYNIWRNNQNDTTSALYNLAALGKPA